LIRARYANFNKKTSTQINARVAEVVIEDPMPKLGLLVVYSVEGVDLVQRITYNSQLCMGLDAELKLPFSQSYERASRPSIVNFLPVFTRLPRDSPSP
jgi:hypothetical protein